MNIYHQLIENPLFFKWIYHPDPEINAYWDHFLKEHPENKQHILEFREGFKKQFQFEKHELSDSEKQELARKILRKLEIRDNQKNKFKIIRMAMRYAAVALFFLIIGSGVTVLILEVNRTKRLAQIPPPPNINIQEPTLILDDKEEIALNKGKSSLEYSDNGEITVDEKKVDPSEKSEKVKMNTLVIPYGNRSTILLADGTKVWLNAGSRLIYPSVFVDKKREVFLVGEAFFQVSKDTKKPFIVKTPDIKVQVLGTQFNISAYPEEKVIQTVLTEGSIELEWVDGGIFNNTIEMIPGQLVAADKSEQSTKIYNVNTEYYTSWKDGYLTFNNSDLNRVVKKLERYYNIRFRYENPMDMTIKISGKLDVTHDKEIVFSYMNSLTGLNFTKINETYYMIK